MTELSLPLFAAVAGVFIIAGLVKGVTGMGLPTVAMALLGGLMSPVAAAGLLLVPSAVTNFWQLSAGPNLAALFTRLWPMMVGIVLGTVPGSFLLSANSRLTVAGLGFVLVAYALYSLFGKQLTVPPAAERWLSPLVGLLTGVVTGATGVFVMPAVPYIQALNLQRDDLVQALGLSFTVSTVALFVGLAWHGSLHPSNLLLSSLAILPALAGMWAGQALRSRISPTAFRRGFLAALLLLGSELALRPWF